MEIDEINLYLEEFEDNLKNVLKHHAEDLLQIRAGRANPKLIERIVVDYYGTPTPISQMATISVPEARMILVSLWDISMLKAVAKAIEESNLGLNPSDDGKVIRLVFPQLTEERRKEYVKEIGKYTENAKVSARNYRRDTLDVFRKAKKDNELTEDDVTRLEKDVQKMLDLYIEKIDLAYTQKEKELMEV